MSLVWDNFNRGGSEKLAMLAMADWCNDAGGSLHPSIATIAKKINLTEKQARVIIHKLITEGWLSVVGNEYGGNPGASRHYQVDIKKLSTPPAEVSPTPPVDVTPPASVTPNVQRLDPSRGGSFTPPVGGSLTTIDPPKEPPIPPSPPKKEKKKRVIEMLPLPEWLDVEAWDMWMRHRKTLTPDAHNVSIRSLTRLRAQGHNPVEVIEQSVMAGWTGLFQLKQTPARAQTTEKGQTRHEQLASKLADLTGATRKPQPSDPRVIHGTAERLD